MVNKMLIICTIFFFSCDKHIDCSSENLNEIYLENFNDLKITSILFADLEGKKDVEYENPVLDSISLSKQRLNFNNISRELIQKGFFVIINNNLKYKITNIKIEEISLEKKTMWGSKIYGCYLKEYNFNDSLISNCGGEILIKR